MKIRWKNTLINPRTDSRFMQFICRYPASFFIPFALISGLGYYFWQIITEVEDGLRDSVWLGKLKIIYDLFGIWGVTSFFMLLAFGCLYLFWVYAVSE